MHCDAQSLPVHFCQFACNAQAMPLHFCQLACNAQSLPLNFGKRGPHILEKSACHKLGKGSVRKFATPKN